MATDPKANRKLRLNRRAALKAIAFGGAGIAIAACGGTTTAPAPTAAPSGGGAAAPTAPAAEAPTAAAAPPTPTVGIAEIGQGSKQVVFWHGLGGADGKTMQEMLKTYAAAKGDTVVRSETYAWDVFYQKLPTAAVAKTPPDLAIMHDWGIKQFASQGILQPADDIFFSTGLVPKDDFNPNLIE